MAWAVAIDPSRADETIGIRFEAPQGERNKNL